MEESFLFIVVVFLLCIHMSLDAVALGPITPNVQRSDGLCNTFVLPLNVYACEEFVVQTDDRFLLGVQRMSKRVYNGSLKGPVFLLHGFVSGGDVWVLNPPEEALAFVLADAGYDVWIGNTRTTTFSYGHISYTRADKGFWDWSVDELATYDLPAMLGLTKLQTNKKVLFVGFSQGSQQALAAFSQGQLIDMVEKVVTLAPVAYINHILAPFSFLSVVFPLNRLYEVLHVYEFSPRIQGKLIVDFICAPEAEKCFERIESLISGNDCCLNYTMRSAIEKYELQSTSTKNMVHLGQQYSRKSFNKFDYGYWGNLMRYHWPSPPAYDLSKVPSGNLLIVHGGEDVLSDSKDVNLLLSLLPGKFPVNFIPEYAHFDFIMATNVKELVYDQVMQFLVS